MITSDILIHLCPGAQTQVVSRLHEAFPPRGVTDACSISEIVSGLGLPFLVLGECKKNKIADQGLLDVLWSIW